MALIVLLGAQPVLAQEWSYEIVHGAVEASVELGPGNSIAVTCTGGFGRPITRVSFSLVGKAPPPFATVLLVVDDNDPLDVPTNENGELPSNSHLDADWFETVRDQLKSGTSVYIRFPDGTGARFPLKGSAEAIGVCPADLWNSALEDF